MMDDKKKSSSIQHPSSNIGRAAAWGITDGGAGMVAQVKALATALDIKPEMKKIVVRAPWAWLPNIFYATKLRSLMMPYFISPASDSLAPPYPDLIISCGRRAAMVAMGLREHIEQHRLPKTPYFIHILDPYVNAKYFDLLIAMEHDRLAPAPKLITTRFALHAITPKILDEARQHFALRFAAYPKPLIAVLLGGSTNKYSLSNNAMKGVIASLKRLLAQTQGSLLITSSRRTGEKNTAMLRQAFADSGRVYIYDFVEKNPYLGMLALADTIIVTNDSVNMMSEACATGKPVYLLPLAGHIYTRPARFAAQLLRDGIARPLGGKLEKWGYKVENEMGRLAEEIKQRLACHPRA